MIVRAVPTRSGGRGPRRARAGCAGGLLGLLLVIGCGPERIEIGQPGPPWVDYYRVADAPGPVPAVMLVHGGCFRGGTPKAVREWAEILRDAGIAAFAVRYRLVAEGGTFPGAIDDVDCAIRWLRREGPALGVDPNRLALLGASAGGYLAAMAAAQETTEIRAPSCGDGSGPPLAALVVLYAVADWDLRCRSGMLACEEAFLGTVCDPKQPAPIFSTAALTTHVASMPLRTLWVHGAQDEEIPPSQALAWERAMRERGADPLVYIAPGVGHGFDLRTGETAEHVHRMVVDFLRAAFAVPDHQGR